MVAHPHEREAPRSGSLRPSLEHSTERVHTPSEGPTSSTPLTAHRSHLGHLWLLRLACPPPGSWSRDTTHAPPDPHTLSNASHATRCTALSISPFTLYSPSNGSTRDPETSRQLSSRRTTQTSTHDASESMARLLGSVAQSHTDMGLNTKRLQLSWPVTQSHHATR